MDSPDQTHPRPPEIAADAVDFASLERTSKIDFEGE